VGCPARFPKQSASTLRDAQGCSGMLRDAKVLAQGLQSRQLCHVHSKPRDAHGDANWGWHVRNPLRCLLEPQGPGQAPKRCSWPSPGCPIWGWPHGRCRGGERDHPHAAAPRSRRSHRCPSDV